MIGTSNCDVIRKECGSEVPCCESCHDDADHGYPMSEIELPPLPPCTIPETFEVCCVVAREFRKANPSPESEA